MRSFSSSPLPQLPTGAAPLPAPSTPSGSNALNTGVAEDKRLDYLQKTRSISMIAQE